MDNTIEWYWNEFSTQFEWAIPCGCRHWNIIGVQNIGNNGLICSKCGRLIRPDHPRAQWVSARSPEWLKNPPVEIPFDGFRIPQVICPWVEWSEINDKRKKYTTARFHNEVLGLGFDSAEKLVNRESLIKCCGTRSMFDKPGPNRSTFMGVDWGTAENSSFTLVTIGCYIKSKFTILFAKRFEGIEAEPERVLKEIKRLIDVYNVDLIGADYGGGFNFNDALVRTYGIQRIFKFQYGNTKRFYFDKFLGRFIVNRTEVLMAVINAINRIDTFEFPKWSEFETPFGEDMRAVFGEHTTSRGMQGNMVVSKVPSQADDTIHSLTYCFLVSMMKHPRPDIIMPTGDNE